MKSLDEFEAADFEGFINQVFTFKGAETGESFEAELVEAELVRTNASSRDAKRAPFCLLFRADSGRQLGLQLYHIANEQFGSMESVHLSTVQPETDGRANFEAIFF